MVAATKNRFDDSLFDATLRRENGLFRFLEGITREQLDYLSSLSVPDAEELMDACRRGPVLLPSMAG